jgi:hypothetical protein
MTRGSRCADPPGTLTTPTSGSTLRSFNLKALAEVRCFATPSTILALPDRRRLSHITPAIDRRNQFSVATNPLKNMNKYFPEKTVMNSAGGRMGWERCLAL